MNDPATSEVVISGVRIRLAAAWTSVMFMYVYADLLGFYDSKLIESIIEGNMPMFGPITPGMRLGIAIMMSIPALAIFISIVAPQRVARRANIIVGVIYTLIILATVILAPLYYKYFGVLEMVLTIFVVREALRWSSQGS